MSHKLRESLRACRLAAQYLLGRPSYQTRLRIAGTAMHAAVFLPFLSAVYVGDQYDRKLGREAVMGPGPVWPFDREGKEGVGE